MNGIGEEIKEYVPKNDEESGNAENWDFFLNIVLLFVFFILIVYDYIEIRLSGTHNLFWAK